MYKYFRNEDSAIQGLFFFFIFSVHLPHLSSSSSPNTQIQQRVYLRISSKGENVAEIS